MFANINLHHPLVNILKFSFTYTVLVSFLFLFSCNIEPYEGEIPEEETLLTCVESAENVSEAAIDFANSISSDADYSVLCVAYKNALMNQIESCGDAEGLIQSFIDSLGDCGVVDVPDEETETTGNYWPMAINNSWNYSFQIDNVAQDDSSMIISGIEDYQGTSSFYYDNFLGATQGTDGTGLADVSLKYYTRNDNGDYHVSVGEMTAELSGLFKITQSSYEYIILKDYLDVGETWSTTFDVTTAFEALVSTVPATPDLKSNYKIDCEILQKDVTINVGGETYSSVIKLGYKQTVSVEGFPASNTVVDYVYYFAKDIGIVKVEGIVLDADDNITSSVLQEIKSYVLN